MYVHVLKRTHLHCISSLFQSNADRVHTVWLSRAHSKQAVILGNGNGVALHMLHTPANIWRGQMECNSKRVSLNEKNGNLLLILHACHLATTARVSCQYCRNLKPRSDCASAANMFLKWRNIEL